MIVVCFTCDFYTINTRPPFEALSPSGSIHALKVLMRKFLILSGWENHIHHQMELKGKVGLHDEVFI